MTATLTAAPGGVTTILPLRVLPARHADRVRELARRAGLDCAIGHGQPGTVTVVVTDDAERALRATRLPGPLLLVCDTVGRVGLLEALRAGAVVLRRADLTEESLTAAVRRAGAPHLSIPYPELSHLLTTGPGPGTPTAHEDRPPSLTGRQMSVLRLMAEGHGNAGIAQLLDCSEHTVKNVVYEVMARLGARNRAHAVARAVRHGLI
ncbi:MULTISPECIES: helix-turn-helix transcriptional regulator [Streptomyces]|uniref:DNA-binding NarL/FixJ family response regulator n=1 Tax=Streptomyces murinus TaxID=33900 RepID=A0A7W3NW09_STRMR|nr:MULTISPECIES: LuxR C-terminal-related transcriptional regulator [Streptomyces]MBA9057729.1 DNA-binding NarL/FixJ family response regulator [Streptomyces murinus]UWW91980.1 DNA-binding response regulator [Streptomyces murinus]